LPKPGQESHVVSVQVWCRDHEDEGQDMQEHLVPGDEAHVHALRSREGEEEGMLLVVLIGGTRCQVLRGTRWASFSYGEAPGTEPRSRYLIRFKCFFPAERRRQTSTSTSASMIFDDFKPSAAKLHLLRTAESQSFHLMP
jgi:hypothetical protein